MSEQPEYVLERVFEAPRKLVWKAWTDPELVPRWYGPNVESIVHRLDVQPGGLWLHEMRWNGNSNYQRCEYTEVSTPQRLVLLQSSSDEQWNTIANPMMPDWPTVLLTTVTFEERAGRTQMRLTWVPHEASEAEIACFAAAIEGMGKGWNAGMDLLEQLLADLLA